MTNFGTNNQSLLVRVQPKKRTLIIRNEVHFSWMSNNASLTGGISSDGSLSIFSIEKCILKDKMTHVFTWIDFPFWRTFQKNKVPRKLLFFPIDFQNSTIYIPLYFDKEVLHFGNYFLLQIPLFEKFAIVILWTSHKLLTLYILVPILIVNRTL